MEAPKKIYIQSFNVSEEDAKFERLLYFDDIWTEEPEPGEENIEYTRTDAFINKALKWYCLDCECNDNCKDTKCFFYREYERYLKGDINAIPPKLSNRILNEDGSTSDNWSYRHFINRIQDAFIEKATEWLKKNVTYTHPRKGTEECVVNLNAFIEAMKGE